MIYRFADPHYLLLLLAIPVLAYWHFYRRKGKTGSVRYSNVRMLAQSDVTKTGKYHNVLPVLRMLALMALVVAFARPQSGVSSENIVTEGIDIVLALDVSSSMLAEDIEPNRIEAAKQVAADFVRGRRNDRIGLVVFAGAAFTQVPLTLDYDVVATVLSELQVGIIDDGTAIGMGLATAVKRLRDSDAESRVIVLLTDGRNNRGEIDPVTAAQMAQALGIKIYSIGAGTRGNARIPIDDPRLGRRYASMRVDIDETTLRETAALTGGRYFRATDRASLEGIYTEIDELETTEIEVQHFTRYGELFHLPLTAGLLLVVLEVALGNTVLRKIP
ncbi:MAG: VWA domain-containing protein [Gemmatimonadota bacterium]|nr:MAG: VWA domain-containing protein [Gemmatimonadota bacterium]